ncbi:EAL domain-containing protein [Solidesulfovibrio carbinolicus]|uniref:EAL domain-containing protein n=1 Tax=Solidesulfovibrio carbinolicus TaxID=296842 RepID=UPI0022A6FBFC|nr:EAL domain-containing protein [Solidesulfovibrio carbinolicus]
MEAFGWERGASPPLVLALGKRKVRPTQKTLNALSSLGASIAIDDFGTGHSALSYLNRFRVDVLKSDSSFVSGVEKDRRKAELVKAFIAVARALDMDVVAEGVELPEQAELLCAHGCLVGQGFLYSRPLPFEEFERLVLQPFSTCN